MENIENVENVELEEVAPDTEEAVKPDGFDVGEKEENADKTEYIKPTEESAITDITDVMQGVVEEAKAKSEESEEKPKQKRHRSSKSEAKPILDENGNVVERLSSEKAMRVLEAILFANGDEVYYDQFARIIGYTTKEAKGIVETYAKLYDNGAFPRGIRLVCYEKCCQLSTCPDMSEYVTKMIGVRGEPQLSNAALETLAIVAYNQPVTRAYVEKVRGVDSTRPITVLLDRELIAEVGRLEIIGRPRLFAVTQTFYKTFGITCHDDLPPLELLGVD